MMKRTGESRERKVQKKSCHDMEDQEWVAFVQSKAEGQGWQLIDWEELRGIRIVQGQTLHPLCKTNRGSCEGI